MSLTIFWMQGDDYISNNELLDMGINTMLQLEQEAYALIGDGARHIIISWNGMTRSCYPGMPEPHIPAYCRPRKKR